MEPDRPHPSPRRRVWRGSSLTIALTLTTTLVLSLGAPRPVQSAPKITYGVDCTCEARNPGLADECDEGATTDATFESYAESKTHDSLAQYHCGKAFKAADVECPSVSCIISTSEPEPLKELRLKIDCDEKRNRKHRPWSQCQVDQLCAMVDGFNSSPHPKRRIKPSPGSARAPDRGRAYRQGIKAFTQGFEDAVLTQGSDSAAVKDMFTHECLYEEWKNSGAPPKPPRAGDKGMNPDHVHDAALGGPLAEPEVLDNLKWTDRTVNYTAGPAMRRFDPSVHDEVTTNPNCGC